MGNSAHYKIFGNRLRNNGEPGEKMNGSGFYLQGFGTNQDIDFGWNQIEDQRGSRAIQVYGHLDNDRIDNIRIHDNFISGSELNNIVLGGSDGSTDVLGTIYVYNNIIVSAGDPGLRGQDATAGSQTLYCPQYVVGGKVWHSMVKIVNLDLTSAQITYRWIGDDGVQIGSTQIGGIAGRGTISLVGQSNFGNSPDIEAQGYLEIVSDGHRLAGSVVFGDLKEERFSTSLPLISSLEQEMVFSQLASNSTYYTGLAIVNPGSGPARVAIEIFDASGIRVESASETIPAGRRKSQLLTQYFPQLASQQRSSGYIRVSSDRPVAAFALFGTHDGSVLSAIPPQTVR